MPDLPTLGPRAAVDLIQTYTGVDFSRVLNFQNRQGLTGQQIITQAFAAISGVNQMLINKYGDLLYITTADTVIYRTGETTRTKTPRKAEFARGDSVRTNRTGHTLPLTDYEDVLDWGDCKMERWTHHIRSPSLAVRGHRRLCLQSSPE